MSIAALTSGAGSSLRNDFEDFVGNRFTVAAEPLYTNSLGRWVISGNTGTHTVKLCDASGNDIPGGSVSIATAAKSVGYAYATLASVIILAPLTTYILVTQESSGGDQWYDAFGVTSTADLTVNGWAFFSGASLNLGGAGQSFGPPNFLYDLTPPSTGRLIRVDMDGGMSDLTGGMSQ